MQEDIAREVGIYHSGQLLCALGLVVYTEVLGRVLRWNDDQANFYGGPRGDEELYRHFQRLLRRAQRRARRVAKGVGSRTLND
jgi:hypothetical protein